MDEKYLRRMIDNDYTDVPNRCILTALLLILDELRKETVIIKEEPEITGGDWEGMQLIIGRDAASNRGRR